MRRAFAWGLAGLLIGPALVYSMVLFVLYTDERCKPGGTGVCHLDIWINLTLGAVFGFAVFFLTTLVRGLIKRRRSTF